jgi:lantibiotic biosynthesis protein
MKTDVEATTTRTATRWQPILTGALASRANETILTIAESFLSPPPGWGHDGSLSFGEAGWALLFDYLARSGDGKWRQPSIDALDRAIESVATTRLSSNLHGGFTGIAWAVEHLRAGEDAGDDANEEIDVALERALTDGTAGVWARQFELVLGLVGIGIYALERLRRPSAVRLLERIVARLAVLSETTPHGITWRTDAELLPARALEKTPDGCYNLGVAHGIPGVVAFLAQVCAAGIAEGEARRLLEGGVAWLLAQRHPEENEADFPAWVAPNGSPIARRVSWCYGNPGLAVALLVAARSVQHAQWERHALDFAHRSARRGVADPTVVEACLCHGTAGNGHLFNRLYHATGDERFRDVACAWFERTFSLQKPGQGIAGFLTLGLDDEGRDAWITSPGLLSGGTGIALALLAATSHVEPAWDRVLCAAIPPRP